MASVTLDFGHGGKDPGATGNGLREKDITLNVGLKVGEILERHNVKVVYTRTTDKFIDLAPRASIANKANTDIFVSIHTNGFGDSSARGIETFSFPGSSKGVVIARDIHNAVLATKNYTINRGLKTANFAVLRLSKMPAALIELGFITNKDDANLLKTKQNEFALAIAKGILKNLGIKYVEEKKVITNNNNNGFYRVVVGSYQDKKNAEEQQKKLKEKGFDSFLAYYEK